MTEATGGITMTPPGDYVVNSVGKSLPGIELKISGDGELCMWGPYVSNGFYKTKNSISSSTKRNLINNFKVFNKFMKYNYFISTFFLISNIVFSCFKKIRIKIYIFSTKIKNLG